MSGLAITRRRVLIAGGGVGLFPGAVRAQVSAQHRVAFLSAGSKSDGPELFQSFLEGLRRYGYVEGRNLVLDARWADYSPERAKSLADEIAASRPAVIVSVAGAPIATSRDPGAIPVVFLHSGDPVAAGLAESYAHPGRNATGVSLLALDLVQKRMDYLKQIVPGMHRMAFLANPEHPGEQRELSASRAAAARLGIEVSYYEARNPTELQAALPAVASARMEAASLFSDGLMLGQRKVLAEFFLKHRIPSVAGWVRFVEDGHLLSYGPDRREVWQRLAYFVDKIIRGARPEDLPIELPTVFELAVNQRTAAAMELVIPREILVRADRVIE